MSPVVGIPAISERVTALPGVGPERAELLGRLGVQTISDLLVHLPRRHEDRRASRQIRELAAGESALVIATTVAAGLKRWRHGNRSVYEVILEDGTGRLHCRWWNLPFMNGKFSPGEELVVFGKVRSLKPTVIDHPETEVVEPGGQRSIHVGRIVPIYPLTEGLSQRWLRALLWRTLEDFGPQLVEPWPGVASEMSMTRAQALQRLHFPRSAEDAETARQRLALDEYLELQIPMLRRRRNLQSHAALPCQGDNRLMRPFLRRLGFKLTDAQTGVLKRIRAELGGMHPMRLLLQGDVGSGKTVVAGCAALMAIESGYQVAMMAPTEVLASQQYDRFCEWFEPLGIPCALWTGSQRKQSGDIAAHARSMAPRLAIGTHALLEPSFAPENLGLAIIDEQHRFGVSQREQLVRKGRYPHLLVMTATPIPRTLGLTLYGDLDIATLDAPPPGRGPLRTCIRTTTDLPGLWEELRAELARGRQAFVICPRVEEDDPVAGLKAAVAEWARVQEVLRPFRAGLLHGRLAPEEKAKVMAEFRSNQVQALVATSLVEVGVDVPNANVMLIQSAECFGLAQLHQLRGRVARSPHPATCFLVASARGVEAQERLRVLESTNDGFRIAEADLRLRGPGELLGQSQSGLPPLRFGDLARDLELVRRARELARRLLETQSSAGLPA